MTDHSAPAPRTYAEARTNADAVEVVNALRAGVPSHEIAGMIRQAESPHQAITLRLAAMVAALGTALAQAHNADPAEAFATWAAEAYDVVAQFAAARDAEGGDGA
ncbi:hypothetical protein [uncultured Dietzia sp.]|uniref:hypothetical protein n=1 Tax=uncultured Dietzia sp. TaxID=395519 RepID=UPI00260C64E2|nr:hypothetical protein [uncultured Dietzia sp.]